MPISADQAREISDSFKNMSHDLGAYRLDNWSRLTADERRDLENASLDLLNYAGSMRTEAVGIALADLEEDLKAIAAATVEARKAIATVNTVKDAFKVAVVFVELGAAIAAKNPANIAKAAAQAFKTAKAVV